MIHPIPLGKLATVSKKYHITAAYLFGSQTNGKLHAESDIDVAVRFAKKITLKKLLMIGNELTALLRGPVDIVDLDTAPLPLQFRVFRARRLLYAENPRREVMKQAKAISLYHDYKYYYDRFHRFEMKRIAAEGLT